MDQGGVDLLDPMDAVGRDDEAEVGQLGKPAAILSRPCNGRGSSRLTWLFVAAGFIWLLIMLDLTLADYLTREDRSR